MKEIDTKKMYKENIIVNKESIVKIACTRNLGLLKANAKLNGLIEAEKSLNNQGKTASLFLKGRIKRALKEVGSMASVRDTLFHSTGRLINESESTVEQSYVQSIAEFFSEFQDFYGQDKKFEECFDGFSVLDEQFLNDYKLFSAGKMEPEKSGCFAYLIDMFANYLADTKSVYEFFALKELIDALSSDFDYFNEKSENFGKPKQTVTKIKKSEIEKLIKLAEENFVALADEIKQQNNMIASLKEYEKQFPENPTILEGIELCNTTLGLLQDRAINLQTFQKRVYELLERLEYSNNVWYSNTKVSRKLKSLVLKPFARKIKPVTDEVYFGSAEAEILKYDARALTVGDTSIFGILIQRTGPAPSLKKFIHYEKYIEQRKSHLSKTEQGNSEKNHQLGQE